MTEIERHGRPVAAIVHDRAQDQETVRAAGAATALMLENQRLDAELRARLVELRASRAGWWRRPTRSDGAWSATSTTARSRASSRSR